VVFLVGTAWASDRGVTLGQVATEEKSNEITAIPELLDLIEIEDALAPSRRTFPPKAWGS
jgi:hypothetical protein